MRPSSDADSEVIATPFAAGLSRLACAICAGSLNVNHLVKYAHHKVAILLELRAPSTCGAAQADSRALVFQGPTSNRVGEIPLLVGVPEGLSGVPPTTDLLLPERGSAPVKARGSPIYETHAL